MTNIEEYLGKRERSRFQNNYPQGASFRRYSEDNYLVPRYPEPGLGGCEPYQARLLNVAAGDRNYSQGILDEDPQYYPSVVKLRRLIRDLSAHRAEWKRRLSTEYNRLVQTCKVTKSYWRSGLAKPNWRKAWYEKVWILGRQRLVMKKVYLKPRLIWQKVLVSFDLESGVKTYETRPKTIHPYRWVETYVPMYRWVLKRPAGWRKVKTRVETKVVVTDWDAVRRQFAGFKLQNMDFRLKGLDLRHQIHALRRDLVAQPRLGASWTTSGFVLPPTIRVPVAIPFYSNPYLQTRGVELPGYVHEGQMYTSCIVYSYDTWCRSTTLESLRAQMEEKAYTTVSLWRNTVIEPWDVNMGLGDRRSVTLPPRDAEVLQKATVEPERVLAAYASLVSLTKASDYTFQIVRSIGELKDTRETFKQAKDFLRWLIRPNIRGLTPKKVYAGLAGAYLAWKFAIQPTIQDVNTVVDNTVSYLTDVRRSLRELVNDLKSRSSIYHARHAYAQQSGLISGRTLLSCDNESFGEFNYSLDWTRRYISPLHFCHEPASDPTYTSDIQVEHVEGSEARGTDFVVDYWGNQRGPATVVDEADDGTQCVMSDSDAPCYASSFLDPDDPRWKENVRTLAHTIQRLHKFRYPYDIRDIAVGALFVSYHAGDILRLAADGRIDLGTIQTFMDQSDALALWLKNPDAQRTAVRELLRHTDITYVAWQLTPLSFVYDWFTTSGTIVEALNSLQRMDNEVLPQPLYGVWQSERHELFSVVPNLRLKERRVRELVREWTVVGLSRRYQGSTTYFAAPARSTIFYDSTWEPSPGTAVFHRTGLYRFRRGEYEAPTGVDAYLPRLRIGLDRGKLVTLAAMLGGFV